MLRVVNPPVLIKISFSSLNVERGNIVNHLQDWMPIYGSGWEIDPLSICYKKCMQSVRLEKEIEFMLVCYHMQLILHIYPKHVNLICSWTIYTLNQGITNLVYILKSFYCSIISVQFQIYSYQAIHKGIFDCIMRKWNSWICAFLLQRLEQNKVIIRFIIFILLFFFCLVSLSSQ